MSFSEFNDHYWRLKVYRSCGWVTSQELHHRDENLFWIFFFTEKSGKSYILHFPLIYDLITNKARKVEVAQSNLMMKGIPHCISLSLSLSVVVSVLLFYSFTFSLSHTISLSLSLSYNFFDAALQLRLCGVMSHQLLSLTLNYSTNVLS